MAIKAQRTGPAFPATTRRSLLVQVPRLGRARSRASVARFGRYHTGVVAALLDELKESPAHLRGQQLDGLEKTLLGLNEDERYDGHAVRLSVIGISDDGLQQEKSRLRGSDLKADLVRLIKDLSLHPLLDAGGLGESVVTTAQIANRLNVSEKTVRRWAPAGLVSRKFRFPDGQVRLGYLESSVQRFIKARPDFVRRAARFSQLDAQERETIVRRAIEILQAQPMKRYPLARKLAAEVGRSVEAIRAALRRYDEENPTAHLFQPAGQAQLSEQDQAILQRHRTGEFPGKIARAVGCTLQRVRQTLDQDRIQALRNDPPKFIFNEEFKAPNAAACIVRRCPIQDLAASPGIPAPSGAPGYLRALYRLPLLSPQQERDLFRQYNFLKYQAAQLCKEHDLDGDPKRWLRAVVMLLARAHQTRERLICANLRLVVSIVKQFTGRQCNDFFEIVSEGNVALMRAVESFDYARGNRFSTYATWAIRRSLAREVTAMRYGPRALSICDQEVLEAVPDVEIDLNEQLAVRELRERVRLAVHRLEGRERKIVLRHFGLVVGQDAQTLAQIGRELGISKERVRQIEQKAMAQLQVLLADPIPAKDRTAA